MAVFRFKGVGPLIPGYVHSYHPIWSLVSALKKMGIVHSTTSLHNKRLVVFLKWLFIGYFRLD